MFWSDLGSAIGYEAIGLVDSSLETVAIFAHQNTEINDNPNENTNEKKEEETERTEQEKTNENEIQTNSPSKPDNYNKGIIFYMKKDRIVGILLWNVFNRISIARKILSSDEKFSDLNDVAKLFDLFDQHHQEKEKENN